jgi:hypothetical protein
MANNTIELFLIQAPEHAYPATDNVRGYNRGLLKYFGKKAIPVQDFADFLHRVLVEVVPTGKKISKLVIGAHGSAAGVDGFGDIRIGESTLDYCDPRLDAFRLIAPFFTRDAQVYILACKTGWDTPLLRRISFLLGGVEVHGYTGFITTTDWGFFTTLDDDTDDGGVERVCWPQFCATLNDDGIPFPVGETATTPNCKR